MILVLDENLSGRSILDRLQAADIPVKAQTELMPRGISDEQVLEYIAGQQDHCLITKDSDFHRHTGIRDTLRRFQVGAFVITGHKDKNGGQLADQIIQAWPKMQAFAAANPPPFVAKILQAKIESVRWS